MEQEWGYTSSLPSEVGTEYQDVVAWNSRVDDVAPSEGILGDKALWDKGVPHAWAQSGYPVYQWNHCRDEILRLVKCQGGHRCVLGEK
jgi:hypothetical protein